jgi:predicted dehydrogenase
VKIAMIGLGYWGQKVLRNLVAAVGVDRVVAVDNSLDRLSDTAKHYPGIGLSMDLDDALANPEVGGVIIATPVETHAAMATKALRAGRHVLVEKPMASSVREALELAELAEARGLALMVGHTFLFSPRIDLLAHYFESGHLGKVHYLTSSRLNLGLVRSDANVIWDLAPHDFSIIFHLLGEAPISVQTSARSVLGERPEVAFINLQFPSGIVASVTVSWLAPRKVRDLTIVGEQRMVVYDDTQNDEPIKVYDKGVVVPESAEFGEHQLTYRYGDTLVPHVSAAEPLARQLVHFLEACETGRPTRSDGWFGLRVVEALEAADLSWQLDGAPVNVSDFSRVAL